MARLLIGSSNVYRFHKLLTNRNHIPYTMVRCTNQDVWNVALEDMSFEKGEVIVSVIENLICDAVAEVTNVEVRRITIEDVIGSFMAQVKTAAQGKPEVKFSLVLPMLRPKHEWYSENYATICGLYCNSIKAMGVRNVAKINGSPESSQIFESDGVHLTESAGKVFVENIIAGAELFFKEEVIDLELETESEMDDIEPSNSEEGWVAKRISIVEKEICQLNKQLKDRERDIMERRIQDSIVTARIREELDHTANSRKEDKIIITGLTSKSPMPKSSVEKKIG